MSQLKARNIAQKFVFKQKATFKGADKKEIQIAVAKVARVIRDLHLATRRAQSSGA